MFVLSFAYSLDTFACVFRYVVLFYVFAFICVGEVTPTHMSTLSQNADIHIDGGHVDDLRPSPPPPKPCQETCRSKAAFPPPPHYKTSSTPIPRA